MSVLHRLSLVLVTGVFSKDVTIIGCWWQIEVQSLNNHSVIKITKTTKSLPFRNFLRFSISHNKFIYGFQIFFIDFRSSIGFIWTLFLKYFWTWDKIERCWKWIWSWVLFHFFGIFVEFSRKIRFSENRKIGSKPR